MSSPDRLSLVILCKRFAAAKQRLSPLFSSPERAELAEAMFRDVLAAAIAVRSVSSVLVVSDEPSMAAIARDSHIVALEDGSASGMNNAARIAIQYLGAKKSGMAAIPADIPLVQPHELEGAIGLLQPRTVALISSQNGGTNFLAAEHPFPIEPTFGPASFERHKTAARSIGFDIKQAVTPGIGFDLDSYTDIERFIALRSKTRTQATLDRLRAAHRLRNFARDVLDSTLWAV